MLHMTVEERIAKELANRVSENTERAVIEIAASIWTRKRGVPLRSVWMRNDLETFKKRLRNKSSSRRHNFGQLIALEKAKEQKEAHGEIETQHPGYLGAQVCWEYQGYWTYQQTFIDTYTTGQVLHGHSNYSCLMIKSFHFLMNYAF